MPYWLRPCLSVKKPSPLIYRTDNPLHRNPQPAPIYQRQEERDKGWSPFGFKLTWFEKSWDIIALPSAWISHKYLVWASISKPFFSEPILNCWRNVFQAQVHAALFPRLNSVEQNSSIDEGLSFLRSARLGWGPKMHMVVYKMKRSLESSGVRGAQHRFVTLLSDCKIMVPVGDTFTVISSSSPLAFATISMDCMRWTTNPLRDHNPKSLVLWLLVCIKRVCSRFSYIPPIRSRIVCFPHGFRNFILLTMASFSKLTPPFPLFSRFITRFVIFEMGVFFFPGLRDFLVVAPWRSNCLFSSSSSLCSRSFVITLWLLAEGKMRKCRFFTLS